jgi:GNAT superfamily N-acetyltransferase
MTDSLLSFTADDVPGLATTTAASPAGGGASSDGVFEKLLWQESGNKQFDKSGKPVTSNKGAIGIAQVMPDTAPEAAKLAGLPWDDVRYRTDAEYNKALGKAYFNKQVEDFGDIGHALAAYNAGPGALRRALDMAKEKGEPSEWLKYLPAETRAYVPSILKRMGITSSEQAAAGAPDQARGKDYYKPNDTQYAEMGSPLVGPGVGDFFREVAASAIDATGSIGQAAGEIGAAVANKVTESQDYEGKNLLSPAADAVRSTMSAGGKAARADQFQGDLLDPSTWKGPESAGGWLMAGANGFGSLLPMLVTTLIPGLGEAAAVQKVQAATKVLQAAQAAGDAAKIAEATQAVAQATQAARAASLATKATGAASEAAMTGGSAAQEVRGTAAQAVQGMTHEQLMQVPAYAQEFSKSGDESQARAAVVNSAGQWAGALSSIAGAAGGAFNAKILEDILMKRGVMRVLGGLSDSRLVRAGVGAAGGHAIEGGQELAEKVGQNAGENIGLGKSAGDNVTRDTLGDFAGGAIVGGGIGGAVGAASKAPVKSPQLQALEASAAAGGPLSKAAIAGNTGPAAQAALAAEQQAGEQQAAAEAEAAKDPLAAQVQQLEATIRQQGALDALRAEDSPVNAKDVLRDLAIAKSASTKLAQREQAVNRLEQALAWAGVNPAPQVASGIEQFGGTQTEGREQKPAPDLATKRTAADRDAQLQAEKNAAGTSAERAQIEAQAQTNREVRLNAPAQPTAAAEPGPAPIQPAEQQRLEGAALAGKQAARKAEDDPRQVIVTRAMKNIEERGGVASPQEAQIVAEAGLGKPYDRIDESLAPQPSMDQKLTQATGIALDKAPRESAVQSKPADTSQADENRARSDSRMAAQERTAQARQRGREALEKVAAATAAKPAEKPPAAKVIEAMKAVAALRNAEQVAVLRAARQHYSAEDMAILSNAAHAPAMLSSTDKMRLDVLRSAGRETTNDAGVTVTEKVAPQERGDAAHSGQENSGFAKRESPAVFRKRRATLRQVIELGLNRVEKRGADFFLTDGKRDFKLEGAADAQLARKEVADHIHEKTSRATGDSASNAQVEAENYRKGEPVTLYPGVTFIAEHAKGTERFDRKNTPPKWRTLLKHAYGDIDDTLGADGDRVDAFIVGNGNRIFVIDQVNPATGKFDEHKVMLRARDEQAAREAYLANYEPGWKGLGAITEMEPEQFRTWVHDKAATQKAVGDLSGAARQGADAVPAEGDGGRGDQPAGGVDDRRARDARSDAGDGAGADAGAAERRDAPAAPVADERQRSHVTVQVEGVPRSVPVVDITEIDGESTARDTRGRVKLSKPHAQLLQAIAGAFGKQVIFFDDISLGDGFVLPGDTSTIFIGTSTSGINPLAVLGHEMWHMIRRESPEAWAAVAKVVRAQMGENTPKMFRDDYHPDRKATNTNAPLSEGLGGELEELVSDLGGNAFTDPKFWNQVMAQIAKDNGEQATSIIARLVAQVQQMVARVAAAIRGQKFAADKFVQDVDAVRAAMRTAMAQYAASRGVRLAALQSQVAKTTQELSRSTARAPGLEIDQTSGRVKRSDADQQLLDMTTPPSPRDTTFRAKVDGKVVGYLDLAVAEDGKTAEVREVKVAKAHQRKGIATALYNQARSAGYEVQRSKYQTDAGSAFRDAYDGKSSDITRSAAREKSPDDDSASGLGPLDAGASGETPSYGTPRAGAVSVVGRHYGTSPRTHLSAQAYGRGLKGGERERVSQADDKRLRDRIYFYVDQGHGITPEAGVGPFAHEVRLNNIYDPATRLVKSSGGMNGFEKAVVDAGFDGYINREFTTKQGAVVLLGPKHTSVPVKFIGTPESAKAAPKDESQEPKRVGLMSKEIDAIDVSRIPGAKLRAGTLTVPADSAAQANEELDRIGSSIRLSTARNTNTDGFDQWFEGSKVRDADGNPLVVYHGTNADFSEFDEKKLGESTEHATAKLGFYFSADPDVAMSFTGYFPVDERGRLQGWRPRAGGNIMPVYLSIGRPKVMSAEHFRNAIIAAGYGDGGEVGRDLLALRKPGILQRIFGETYDGVLIKGDPSQPQGEETSADVWVAFKPTQIKSAIGNDGNYRIGEADITRSTARQKLRPEVAEIAKPVLRFLTPTERAKLRVDTATKMVELFKSMPSANEMAAIAHAGRAKRGWYAESAKALVHVFGPDAPRFAALLAAMSPQTSVETNLRNALQTWKNWTRAGRPVSKGEIFEIMGRSVEGNKLTDSVLPAWVPNSVRALSSPDPETVVLSGPKVNSFMLNLRGVASEVTNDAWMANYSAVDQQIFGGSLNVAGTDPGKGPGYLAMNARVRQAAARLEELTGEEWTPAEVQETIWSWAKTLYELQDKDMGARELLDNEAVTDDLIRSTPDFRTQLHEERNEDTLRQAGYGEQLDSLRSRVDHAGAGEQGSGAGSKAGPFDPDTQGKHERRAASRLEQLRDDRLAAERAKAADAQRSTARDGSGRDESRSLAPLEGAPAVQGASGPDARLVEVAERYARGRGIALRRQGEYVKVDPERAARIADAYQAMPHAPQDPKVRAAYADLIRQVREQYDALVDAGYVFTFFDAANDPYQGNPWNAMRDLRANQRMAVYGTYDGYGTEGITQGAVADNPMLADTGLRWPDQAGQERMVTANDLFRAVHDAFGHGLEGAGFRADGEENAWQAHVRLFTGPAVGAITSETRGQNSWLNFGPYGERNRTAKLEDTVFADQKTGLMPAWTWTDGLAPDMPQEAIAPTPVKAAQSGSVEERIATMRELLACLKK